MKYLILLVLFASSAFADSFKGNVPLTQGYEVYVDYSAPQAGQPTVVLVNGLVYNLDRWDAYATELSKAGVGVLRYYFRGQSLTLLNEAEGGKTPAFFKDGISYQDLSVELGYVLESLKIEQKVSLVGLSFGSAIASEFAATHPDRVENLILLAPMVVPLDRYNPMGAWIHQSLDTIRFWWGPQWGAQAYEFYYDMIYHSYLVDQRITPESVPPEIKSIPEIYKEAIFHLVRAVRDFDLKSFTFEKVAHVHLVLASGEDAPVLIDQFAAWNSWNETSRASLTYIEGASHAIPDSQPAMASAITLKILNGDADFRDEKIHLADHEKIELCSSLAALQTHDCH